MRQAFAHSVDRNAIINALLAPLAIPAYGYLMEGYPFAISQPLEKYTNYDPELAQKLLAEAGYPKGKGFPTVTFSYPAGNGVARQHHRGARRAGALATTGTRSCSAGNSTLLLSEMDTSTFYTKMEALPTQVEMGFVSYGMDYFDASNMLERLQGRRPPRLGQRPVRQPAGPGCRRVQQGQAPGDLHARRRSCSPTQAPGVFVFHGLDAYLM